MIQLYISIMKYSKHALHKHKDTQKQMLEYEVVLLRRLLFLSRKWKW